MLPLDGLDTHCHFHYAVHCMTYDQVKIPRRRKTRVRKVLQNILLNCIMETEVIGDFGAAVPYYRLKSGGPCIEFDLSLICSVSTH